jgi:hypothetical protein
MQETTRRAIVSALSDDIARADELKQELDALVEHHQLYQDKSPLATASVQVVNETYKFVRRLRETNDTLKRSGAAAIAEYVRWWYKDLHYDMHPLPGHEIPEDQEPPEPTIERVSFQGGSVWEVILVTPTHGRERIIVHSDTASWDEVYSAERIG